MFRRALLVALVVCSMGILFAAVYPAAAGSIAETPTPTPDGDDDGSDASSDTTAEDGSEADEDDDAEEDGSDDEADDEDDRWYSDWGSDDDRRSEYGSERDGEDGDDGPDGNDSDDSAPNASEDADAREEGNDTDDGEDDSERRNETQRRNGTDERPPATDNRSGDDEWNRTGSLTGSLLDLTNDTVRAVRDGVAGDLDGDGDPDVELVEVDDGSVRVGGLGGETADGADGSDGGVEVVAVELEEDLIDDRGRVRAGNVTVGGVLVVPLGPAEIIAGDSADEGTADRPSLDVPPVGDAMARTTPASDRSLGDADGSEGSGPDADAEPADQSGSSTDADDEGGAGGVPGSGAGAGAALVVTVGLLGGTRTAFDQTAVLASQGPGSTLVALRQAVAKYLDELPGVLPALFGYSRHDGSDPLENETRAEIYDLVRESPGTYHAQLAEETGVAVETVRYHSRILEEEGLVEARKIRGRRRLFPVTMDDDDPELAAAIADSAASDVLSAIERREPTTLSAIAEAVDCAPSTVSYHIDRLEDDGLVTRERDGGAVRVRLRRSTRSALQGQVADD